MGFPRKRRSSQMQRLFTIRRRTVALSFAIAAIGFASALPLAAQEPAPAATNSKFRVLVPTLEERGEVRGDFGKKVAEQVVKRIEQLATHTPVESKELRESLRKYK